jgi:hypothetical protein
MDKIFTDAVSALLALANMPMILLTFVLTSLLKPVMISKPGAPPRWYQGPFEDPDNYIFFVLGLGFIVGLLTELSTPNFRGDQLLTKVLLAGCVPGVMFKLGKTYLPTSLHFLLGERSAAPGEALPTAVVAEHAKKVVLAYQKGADVGAAISKLEAAATAPPAAPQG